MFGRNVKRQRSDPAKQAAVRAFCEEHPGVALQVFALRMEAARDGTKVSVERVENVIPPEVRDTMPVSVQELLMWM